jgi:hypothetical protein
MVATTLWVNHPIVDTGKGKNIINMVAKGSIT